MTELTTVLRQSALGDSAPKLPRNARRALAWLQIDGARDVSGANRVLEVDELRELAEAMLGRFDGDPEFTWSSYIMRSCLEAFAEASQGPPETFLRVVWERLESRPLDQNVFNLLEAVSVEARGAGLLDHPCWDLEWLLRPTSPAQECAQFWLVGLRKGLVDRLPEDDPVPKRMDRFF